MRSIISTPSLMTLVTVTLCLACDPATSQSVGIYSGYTEKGEPVRLQVQPDPYNGGVLSIMMLDLSFSSTCPKSGVPASTSFYGGSIPISFRRFATYSWFGSINLVLEGTFDSDDEISGTITGGNANYLQGTFKVENCSSIGVRYSAKLDSDAVLPESLQGPIRAVIREPKAVSTNSLR